MSSTPDATRGPRDWESALSGLGERLERDRPLGPLCSYKVGGPARWFIEVNDTDELVEIAAALASVAASARPEVLVVGRGSNLLVADRGFDGLAIALGSRFEELFEIAEPDEDGQVAVRVGGAARLPVVARRTVAAGLTGFE